MNEIERAAEAVKKGGVVIYPTETAYALGADVTNREAVKKVFLLKKRNFDKPLTAIVSGLAMAKKYCILTDKDEMIASKFMPGPLTLVVKKKRIVPDIFDAKEFAFRISSNWVANALVNMAEKPITATSANLSGEKEHYSVEDIPSVIKDKVDAIIDAGELPKVKMSTIIDLFDGLHVRREGSFDVRKIIGKEK